jgi:hypothetical protein
MLAARALSGRPVAAPRPCAPRRPAVLVCASAAEADSSKGKSKRDKSGWNLFSAESCGIARQQLLSEGLPLGGGAVMQRVGVMWRALSHDQKAQFNQAALDKRQLVAK